MRAHPRRAFGLRCIFARLAASLLVALCSPALAQETRTGELSVQRFEPAPGPRNFLTVAGARTDGDPSVWGAVVVSYARDPLRVRHCEPGPCSDSPTRDAKVPVISHLATAHFVGALTVVPRLQVGVRMPFHYVAGDGIDSDASSPNFGRGQVGGLSGGGPGDPALEAKFRVVGDTKSTFAAGGALWASAPLGRVVAAQKFLGETSPGVGFKGIADARFGKLALGVNAGGFLRQRATLGSLDLGPEARLGLAGSYDVSPGATLVVEAFGSSNFTTASGTNAAEAAAAAKFKPIDAPVLFVVGGGAGLNQGLGAPLFRGFGGIEITVDRPDERAVDRVADRDGDGVLDREDRCPDEGGDVVREAGPFLGCPRRDSDGDGVFDNQDACPDRPGVRTTDPATNGCPDPDRDRDGVPNDVDRCPDEPETVNGFQDGDGCPDVVPIQVEVRPDEIVVINEKVNFEFNSDRIVGARSFEALDLVARVMAEHREIKQIEVGGHTDNVGTREMNQGLSERRAGAVVSYLASKGVGRERMVARGYGQDRPLTRDDSEQGRAMNRRVEFKIAKVDKGDGGDKGGKGDKPAK